MGPSEEDDGGASFVNARHAALHFAALARGIVAHIPSDNATVLVYDCGEALSADRIAARCSRLLLCDERPSLREALGARFAHVAGIEVMGPDEIAALPDHSLDLVVAQDIDRITSEILDERLGLWRSKLKEEGALILADIAPPETGAWEEAMALLRFAWAGGFLGAALLALARRAFADGDTRPETGDGHYREDGVIALLGDRNFEGARLARGFSHDSRRMTFKAKPL